jgi:hypothetical protein
MVLGVSFKKQYSFFDTRYFLRLLRVGSRELADAPAFFSGGLSLVPHLVVQYRSEELPSSGKDATVFHVFIAACFDNPTADLVGSVSDVHLS